MSKAIFRWDANGYFCSSDVKPDDYQLKANETFDEPKFSNPSNALTPYKRVAGGWQASTQEEHDAYIKKQEEAYYAEHPEMKPQPAQPSAQDQALNALGLQLAQVQKTQAAQAQAINALGLQFAAVQGKDAKTQGGNQ